jgi:hypothetical protein
MADNANATAGDGTIVVAADDIGGVKWQRVKATWGPDGTANDTDVATGKPLPIQVRSATGLIPVGEPTDAKSTATDTTSVSLISINKQISASAQLSATAAKQPALGTAGSASTDVITVQGIASGTALPASQSGIWTVQPGNTANTTAWKVDGSAVTQPISSTALVPGTAATNLGKAEDAAHTTGDTGVMSLAVRNNTASALAGTDGDYIPLTTNTRGAIWMAIEDGSGGQVTSFSGPTQYTEDAAAASDPVGSMMMAVRRDTLSTSEVSADGDNIALKATNKGALHVNMASGGITAGTAGTASTDVVSVQGIASGTALAVSIASGSVASGAVASGAVASGAFASGSIASGAVASGAIASGAIAAGAIAAGATSIAANEDDASADGDRGVKILARRTASPANTSGTDLDYEMLQVSAGRLWASATIDAALPAGSAIIGSVTGSVAHDGVDSGNPLKIGGRARSSEIAAVSNDDRADIVTDLVGKQIVLPYANPENFVSGAITSAMTGTTTTSLLAAPASGLRNYITQITVSNSHATVGTDVIIQDGSGGTTLYVIPAAAVYGGAVLTFPTPLRQPTTATAIFCANVTTGSNTKVSASGYKGA